MITKRSIISVRKVILQLTVIDRIKRQSEIVLLDGSRIKSISEGKIALFVTQIINKIIFSDPESQCWSVVLKNEII